MVDPAFGRQSRFEGQNTSGFTFYLQPLKEAVSLWIGAVP
jgi:hypothetical protein